jgi:hypothetical protein
MKEDRKAEKLGRKVINAFTRRITDEIFLFLERDPELVKEYRAAVKKYSAHSVNAALGKMISEAYGLGNLSKETKPDCPLLKRYTRHYVRWDQVGEKKRTGKSEKDYAETGLFAQKPKKQRGKGRKLGPRRPEAPPLEENLFDGKNGK